MKKLSELKKDLWTVFSRYIKMKYSDGDYCYCYTCDKVLRLGTSDCQGGHFLPRNCEALRFHEDNVRPQCEYCNTFLRGNTEVFEEKLIQEIGTERVNWLHENKRAAPSKDRSWYVDQIKYYKSIY